MRFNILSVFLIVIAGINPAGKCYAFSESDHGFIENKGQIVNLSNKPDPEVLYLLNNQGLNVQLRKTGFSYDVYTVEYKQNPYHLLSHEHQPLSRVHHSDSLFPIYHFHRIDLTLAGANPLCQIIPSEPLQDYFNYFTAATPPEGIKNVRQYSKITYQNIYPGIDLDFYTDKDHGYKYNFIIHPGADINDIRLKIDGPDHISFIDNTLKFGTRFGDVEEVIPESYYLFNSSRVDLHVRFKKINNELYGFSINKPIAENSILVIDPTSIRLWGTYYGGSGWEGGNGCSVDKTGNVFLSGTTNSLNNIASTGAYQGTLAGNYDCFLVKFSAAGQRQWGTYFGGAAMDEAVSCIVDISGNIYFTGDTQSTSGIASIGAHQTVYGGGSYDCYIEKFNQVGDRLWGTYYGGSGLDEGGYITTDNNGNVFLAGVTSSDTGIATPGSYQPNRYNTSSDAFLAKFDSNGVRKWGTYFGGELNDFGEGCSIDVSGNIYLSGGTSSHTNIASPGGFQTTYGGGTADAFLVKFSNVGQRVWATYYGGSNEDQGYVCTSDMAGNVCMVGRTNSPDGIASPGCHQYILGGNYDGYIVKFDSVGLRLWGTYYGGPGIDEAYSCAFGWNNDIFMAGFSMSTNNISTPNSYQPVLDGISDAYLVKFNAGGQRQWGTYYGGSGTDNFTYCNYIPDDTLYLAGGTYSTDNIASQGAWQEVYGGGTKDDMLIKFLDCWPIIAGPISGPDTICKPPNAVSYSIPSLVHAVNYVWTVSPGIIIVSGQGTPGITVDMSSFNGSGMIIVKGFNKCGDAGDSAYLDIAVHQAPVPVISGPSNTCAGPGKVYLTDPGKTNYQWSTSSGGVITSGGTTNTVTITWNVTGIQHVYANYTDANGCSAQTSMDFPVLVTPSPAVNVTIGSTSTNVCEGTLVTYTATPLNGGNNAGFQWQVNGINAGTNVDNYTYAPANNDIVRCILTSSITGCIMNNPDTSNAIIMVVNPILGISVSISASANPYCQGATITFTAAPTNEGITPQYQWKVNGVNVGANNPVYSYVPANGDIVSCILNSSIPCPTGNPAVSNTVTMAENTNLTVSISIAPSQNPVCGGTNVTFTASSVNQGSNPVYQWKVNGINVGTNNPAYSFVPLNGDVVLCILTSNAPCASGNPATSNTVIMTVNPNLPVSITVSPTANPVCAGATVVFTAYPVNEGTSPVYQWKVNGANAGINSITYSYIPANGDIVTCVLTSNAVCPTGNPATSNSVTMTVNPNLLVSISIVASSNPFCSGSSVTFTATPANEGTSPQYQWKVNGTNAGTNIPTYTYNPSNGDQVSCSLTSNLPCTQNNPVTSNTVTMIVNNALPAGVSITANPNPFCPGTIVNYTATPVNGGTSPQYQWKVNGTNQGTNSPNYTYAPLAGDSIRCVITSNLPCVTNNPASSNKIVMSLLPVPAVSFALCFDSITTVNAAPFQLKGGVPLGGTYSGPGVNSSTGIFTPSLAGTGTKTITYSYTNMYSCSVLMNRNIIVQAVPSFNCGQNLTDIRDNKIYPTIPLGTQCWMQKNLNYGSSIQGATEQTDNCMNEKYCYSDNAANCSLYGGLYQWDELMAYTNTPGAQGLCPAGWHVPTQNEWIALFTFYQEQALAGKPLQDSIFNGFRAKESGIVYSNISWKLQGFATLYWTSSPYGTIKALSHGMNLQNFSVSDYYSNRSNAFAVRCVKD
jgi:uncharacterized protein (TIGR02145 family)